MGGAADSELAASTLVAGAGGQDTDLAAPAETKDTDVVVDGRVAGSELLADGKKRLDALAKVGLGREEVTEGLLLLGGVGGEPLGLGTVTLEEVREEDEGTGQGGEEVGALDGLGPDAKDVVDGDDGLCSVTGADNVCKLPGVALASYLGCI